MFRDHLANSWGHSPGTSITVFNGSVNTAFVFCNRFFFSLEFVMLFTAQLDFACRKHDFYVERTILSAQYFP